MIKKLDSGGEGPLLLSDLKSELEQNKVLIKKVKNKIVKCFYLCVCVSLLYSQNIGILQNSKQYIPTINT